MDTVVRTVDAFGCSRLLVAVENEQTECCFEEKWQHRLNPVASVTACTCRSLVSATTEIASVVDWGTHLE